MFKKIKNWYNLQTSTTKGMVWFGIVLVIGIIIRWSYVIEHIKRGFEFYSINK